MTLVCVDPTGWFKDPYELHEARWFSEGRPTSLVRNGMSESSDEPPRSDYEGTLELLAQEVPDGPVRRGLVEEVADVVLSVLPPL